MDATRSFITDRRPLVAHVVFNFAVGGLENGVVNLVNHMPPNCYRHAVISLTGVSEEFTRRIQRDDVMVCAVHKPPGHGWQVYPQLCRILAKLKPTIVHTRNLAALEAQVPAWLTGVAGRVHGEHGWDVGDLEGGNRKYRLFRTAFRPLVHRYIALSKHIAAYLSDRVGVPSHRIAQIYNGVDLQRFHPAHDGRGPIPGCPFDDPRLRLVGTVGRMQQVKDQTTLARAFVDMVARFPSLRDVARLVMIGDGPLRAEVLSILDAGGLGSHAWLPGERADVPGILRGLDCFVLPSLAEGISNTILEAMASGLPVVATAVGGNGELVVAGQTGELVAAGDAGAMAVRIGRFLGDSRLAREAGASGRKRVEESFGLDSMVDSYMRVYDDVAGVQRSTCTMESRSTAI